MSIILHQYELCSSCGTCFMEVFDRTTSTTCRLLITTTTTASPEGTKVEYTVQTEPLENTECDTIEETFHNRDLLGSYLEGRFYLSPPQNCNCNCGESNFPAT